MPFDIGKLLVDIFKDVDSVHSLLTAYGHTVNKTTVYQWFYRDALPAKWVLVLLALREIEYGGPIPLAPYLK